ncbi:Hypothetical predicted protein [Mytilus galloprovincialis]|uniref:Caspase recruitment domain-containing protein n=1 Tax=Mytilus galloprovincialis TaxID=29158 RepID=A0A8B6EPZ0_MYTGA|nr:Hypothetical predicted protein [Mytilus galloprovincialis]
MSSDDIKMILRKFYVALRTNVDPSAVTPVIEGLTVFDKQQIQATTRMDGAMLGNDKLLDTLGRRTTRTFLSFVTVLKEYNLEIANEIMQYAQDHFPNIHTSIRNFERHHNQIPSATVKPSVASGSDAQNYPLSESHSIHQRTTFSQRPDAGSQSIITREQESRDTYSSGGFTVQSVHRTREVTRQVKFTEETLLEDVPNIVFKKWAAELNNNDYWNKLGDIMQLSRKQMKDLKSKEKPGEEILDILCSKESVTVKQLMQFLDVADLPSVHEVVKQSLVPSTVIQGSTNQTTAVTDTRLHGRTSTDQDPVNRDVNKEKETNNSSEKNKAPLNNSMKKLNISDDSIKSNTDNEEVLSTECLPGKTDGASKTLINNLSSTHMKFDAVKTVHIHLHNDKENPACNLEENTEENDEIRNVEREVSAEDNPSPTGIDSQQSPNLNLSAGSTGNNNIVDDTIAVLHRPGIIPPSSGGDSSIPEHDTEHIISRLEPCNTEQQLLANPENTTTGISGKNLEQERAALSEDFQNPLNLDSFRDIQNSIPGTRSSENNRGLVQQISDADNRQYRIQHPVDSISTNDNVEKNADQDHRALQRDVEQQLRLESDRNLQTSEVSDSPDTTLQNSIQTDTKHQC